jgi:uncharacterized protein (DUF952 family)
MIVYHIVLPEQWAKHDVSENYVADSLAAEGFIHCSHESQLSGVLERYYSDVKEVVILTIDGDKLTSPLVEEPSTNDELYPHIYGPIDRVAIIASENRTLDA